MLAVKALKPSELGWGVGRGPSLKELWETHNELFSVDIQCRIDSTSLFCLFRVTLCQELARWY